MRSDDITEFFIAKIVSLYQLGSNFTTFTAELVMGKAEAIPVAVIRGINPEWLGSRKGVVSEIVRSPEEDLFR